MSRLRANQITNENANGAPNFPHGLTVTGIVTATTSATTMSQIVVGSAVTANSNGVDTVGIVTAGTLKDKAGGTFAPNPTTTRGDVIVRGVSVNERLPIGSAGQALKVNAGATGLEYGAGGGVLGMNQYHTFDRFNVNPSGSDWAYLRSAHKVDYTAKSTTSHFLLESFMSCGMDTHDTTFSMNWWDSLKGASNGNELFSTGTGSGSRTPGTFAMFPSGASVAGGWDDYWLSGEYSSVLYYPAAGQRSTSARSFYPVIKSNAYDGTLFLNYAHSDHTYNMTGSSLIRVTEIEGSIVG